MTEIVKAGENLFLALDFPPGEAEILRLRADLMAELRLWIQNSGLADADAAKRLGLSLTALSDLKRGKWKRFSLDKLFMLAAKTGMHIRITLEQAA
jgi:predicted XRE-type DNA-binding protein